MSSSQGKEQELWCRYSFPLPHSSPLSARISGFYFIKEADMSSQMGQTQGLMCSVPLSVIPSPLRLCLLYSRQTGEQQTARDVGWSLVDVYFSLS